jgi:hypothetical protein
MRSNQSPQFLSRASAAILGSLALSDFGTDGSAPKSTTIGTAVTWSAKHLYYAHLPIPDKRFDVKRIESSRNLSVKA